MSRYAKIIPMAEFQKKIQRLLELDDFPYEMSTKITQDLSKINFDWENYNIGNADPDYEQYPEDFSGYAGYPCGFETLENGMPVFFINAGGDWEHPICLCLYWDGKALRGYIPEEGNVFNKKERCAYGSEEDMDDEMDYENLPKGDADAIRKDVMARIIIR